MRIKETKVYEFDELSEEAKESAINDFRENREYFWGDDNEKTLNAFVEHFSFIGLKDWSYGSYNGSDGVYFTYDDELDLENMSAYRFYKYLLNNGYLEIKELYGKKDKYIKLNDNCCLTGYCMDIDILEPILNLMKNPLYYNLTAYEVIELCFSNWIKSCVSDMEYTYTDEAIEEDIKINDYEFTIEGDLVCLNY